jgi:taurine dioxygenase
MSSQRIEIIPVAGRIGAEIRGVDLRTALSKETVAEIRAALLAHKVVFFRKQEIDEKGQVAFAKRFGPTTLAHPTVPALVDHPEVLDLDYRRSEARANNWHTDVTFVDAPPLGSVLRAITIPPAGGDTVWANSETAYEDLPAPLRSLADQLWAVHTNSYDYAAAQLDLSENARNRKAQFESIDFETLHPVVRVHPETGVPGLFIGGFARRIKGLSPAESAEILKLLQSYVTRLENSVRWRWSEGDVAFWDNRATQHYAVADYGTQPRHVRRVTIVGDVPVGLNGERSQALKGDASHYNQRARAAA